MSHLNRKLGNPTLTLLFLISISFFGLILTILLALHPPISQENFVWRKTLVGSTYSVVCVLGILAVFFPTKCSRFFDVGKRDKHPNRFFGFKLGGSISRTPSSTLRGHHPQCGRFSVHVFRLGSRMFCATCSGLFLGALFVLVGVVLYFFGNLQMEQNALLAVLVGAFGVILGLLQSLLSILQNSIIRLFSSAFFVVGTFLILIGNEELAHNTSVDLFLIVLSVLWLMTRISLSQWDHERICSKCILDSCSFVELHTKRGNLRWRSATERVKRAENNEQSEDDEGEGPNLWCFGDPAYLVG